MAQTVIVDEPFAVDVLQVHREKRGALDIETTIVENPWVDPPKLVSVAVTFDGDRSFVIPPDWVENVRHILEHTEWIMHNGLFDRLMLDTFFDIDAPLVHDTMAMQYLLDPDEPKSLEELSKKYLKLDNYKDVDYKNILDEPFEKVAEMNAEDVRRTFNLYRPLADQLNRDKALSRVYQWIIMPAINKLIKVTQVGIPVDVDRLENLTVEYEKEVDELFKSLVQRAPEPGGDVYPEGWPKPSWWRVGKHGKYEGDYFNPNSPHQIRHILFDLWDLPPLQFTKDQDGNDTDTPSTNKDVLLLLETFHSEGYQQEWIMDLRKYREKTKLLSYLHAWPDLMDEKGYLHPRYKPLHVVTGRLSSHAPNIQNVPRKASDIRTVFGGVEGYDWMKADYSQIEMRLAAEAAQEEKMLAAFRRGEDLHSLTAKLVLGDDKGEARQVGKTLNFGLLFGAGPATLRRVARTDFEVFLDADTARFYHSQYFRSYPALERWHQDVKREVTTTGKIRSALGRIRYLPNAKIPWHVEEMRGHKIGAIHEAINHPIQSLASDLLLMSLIRVAPLVEPYGAHVIAEVHDEIDLLVPQEHTEEVGEIVKATMEDLSWLQKFGMKLEVPVLADVETGPYWGQLKGES